jgi:membrane dipeptidase
MAESSGARALPIVDSFTDLLNETVVLGGEDRSLDLVLRRGRERLFERYWLPRLEAGGVGVQICPLHGTNAPPGEARAWAIAQEAELRQAVEENAARMCQVRRSTELDAEDRFRLILSMEGLEPLEGDPGSFEEWHALGVRMVSLTWNHANEFAGGIYTPTQGLTDRGRTLVRRLPELGVVLDLAHASEQTWRDVVVEELPFSVSHACCRAVHDHARNLADWQLEALAERGGVLGMMALAFVVDPDTPTLSRWLDHFDHAVQVMGIDHVGLGADFVDQVTSTTATPDPVATAQVKAGVGLEGFTAPDDYPALVASLRDRGYDGERLEAIAGGNWLRVLRQTLPA